MPPRSGRCRHCRCLFVFNSRLKDQRYCGRRECQRVRRRLWQRQKMATDADYQQNQRAAQKHWQQEHPEYWRQYRERHPDYAENNRRLQRQRDQRLRLLAKMDASGRINRIKAGTYYLLPGGSDLAKMDALAQKITLIPEPYRLPGGSCKQGLDCLRGPGAG
jgi:hypothetical protein